jgi:hypothetical protein
MKAKLNANLYKLHQNLINRGNGQPELVKSLNYRACYHAIACRNGRKYRRKQGIITV